MKKFVELAATAISAFLFCHNHGREAKTVCYLLFLSFLSVAMYSRGETFKWNCDGDYHSFGDAANWIDSNGDAVAAGPSSSADNITYNSSHRTCRFDLYGVEHSIGNLTDDSWNYAAYAFRNGSLDFASGTTKFSTYTTMSVTNATVKFLSTVEFGTDYSSGIWMPVNVYKDGVLEIDGDVMFRRATFNIYSGGRFVYGNNARALNANANTDWNVHNYGTLDWPNGFRRYNSTWSFRPYIRQYAGANWILGDVLTTTQNIYMRIELYGGTVTATNNVTFQLLDPNGGATYENGKAYAKFMPNADVTLDVSEGKTMDMARNDSRYAAFVYEPSEDGTNYTRITRTGAGTLLLSDIPYSLDLQSGTTTFSANTRTAMGSLKVGAGQSFMIANVDMTIDTLVDNIGTITIAQPGLSIGALGSNAALSGTFSFTVTSFVEGNTIVTTPDATLRAKIKEDAETAFAASGAAIVENGDALLVGAPTFVFDSTTVTDLNDPSGWQSGLPVAGSDVIVSGVGVNAIVSADLTNVWNSITVQDGASVRIAVAGLSLPAITLRGGVSLTVAADYAPASLTTYTEGAAFPKLTVTDGAKFTVPVGQRFSNVHLVLCDGATLTESGDGPLVFGYAAAGETTYFAMHATNATITALNSAKTENASRIDFASPESGGTVVVSDDIVLKDCTVTYNSKDGFAFGYNNPTSQVFKVIADNTELDFGATTYVAGSANLVMTNGSLLCRKRHSEGDTGDSYYNLCIEDAGLLTLVSGGELRTGVTRVNGDVTNGAIYVTPEVAGTVGIEVLKGGIGCWYKGHGQNKGVIRFADGYMDCFKGYWWGWSNRAHIFNYMVGIDVPQGKTMTFRGVPNKFGSNSSPNNHTMMIESPFSGGGNILVTNTWNGKLMMPVIMSGANSCTGRIEALACSGTALSKVYFQNGANWAGTVVANGRMEIADTFTGATATHNSPVAVSFGALDLQADFPVKVWKPDGEPMTNDTLNVGTYLNNGGALVPELATDGAEFSIGDSFVVGKIAKDGALPRVPAGWIAKKQAIDGDDANDNLILKRGIGLQVLVR